MLNLLHSRKTGYFFLVLAVLALEIFLGWRSSIMYAAILSGEIGLLELNLIKWLVFLAIAVFGFTLSVHRHYGAEAIVDHMKQRGKTVGGWAGIATAMVIVIFHDLAATVYTVFGDGKTPTFPLIAATAGMSALCFVPFLTSRMMRALHDGVAGERQERHELKMQSIQHKQEIKTLKQNPPTAPKLASATPPRQTVTGEFITLEPVESEAANNGATPFRPQQTGNS